MFIKELVKMYLFKAHLFIIKNSVITTTIVENLTLIVTHIFCRELFYPKHCLEFLPYSHNKGHSKFLFCFQVCYAQDSPGCLGQYMAHTSLSLASNWCEKSKTDCGYALSKC